MIANILKVFFKLRVLYFFENFICIFFIQFSPLVLYFFWIEVFDLFMKILIAWFLEEVWIVEIIYERLNLLQVKDFEVRSFSFERLFKEFEQNRKSKFSFFVFFSFWWIFELFEFELVGDEGKEILRRVDFELIEWCHIFRVSFDVLWSITRKFCFVPENLREFLKILYLRWGKSWCIECIQKRL